MNDLLAHPAVQSVALPVALALVLMALCRMGGARRHAAAAVVSAVLVCAVLTLGVSAWPPRTGMHKLPWLLAAALPVGLVLDLLSSHRGVRLATAAAFAAAALAWLAWPQRDAGSPLVQIALAGAFLAAVLLVLWRLARHERPAAPGAVMLTVASAALAAVAFESGSLAIAQLCAALAAAGGAFAAWALLFRDTDLAGSGLVGGGGALVMLAAATALLTDAPPWALAALPAVFLADVPAARLRLAGLPQALAVAAAALLPAVAAVVLAAWLRAPAGPYYQ